MAFEDTRVPFIPKVNTTLTESDKKNGANPLLWSIEDIIQVYGGSSFRAINNMSVLRYKIDLQSIMEHEKKIMLEQIKMNLVKDIENKLLRQEVDINRKFIDKQANFNNFQQHYRGGLNTPAVVKNSKSTKSKSLLYKPITAGVTPPGLSESRDDKTFGINLVNNFLENIKMIDFNTDMRIFLVDSADPLPKRRANGGGKKSKRMMKKKVKKTYKR
jgi:hypothetical protein